MASKITYADKVTKKVLTEENIKKVTADDMNEIKRVVNENADEIIEAKSIINTTTEIAENTNYTIPLNYKVGSDVLDIYYMGEKLIKGTHYIEVGTTGSVSNTIQFYEWGQAVPSGRTIEFIVRGVYE